MTSASACGKVILFGEHAVVYGRPAIAAPVSQVRAEAVVRPGSAGSGVRIIAPDLRQSFLLADAPADHPLAAIVRLTLEWLDAEPADLTITLRSELPRASGLGSGAAISTAAVRALARHFGRQIEPDEVSALAYEVERIYHGTPGGIDNTVIAWERPIRYARGEGMTPIKVPQPFTIIVGNSGLSSRTREVVADVRAGWEREPARYEELFDEIGAVVEAGRHAIEAGEWARVGALMDQNHALLQDLGVSSPALDRLTLAARQAGAYGAKLCGAGRGGNMIALADACASSGVGAALLAAGAAAVITTVVQEPGVEFCYTEASA